MTSTVDLRLGDCLELMRDLPDNSVDACITDPPYNLTANKRGGSGMASVDLDTPYGRARIGTGNGGGFMGQAWDGTGIAFKVELWREVLRIMKPGAMLLAFGGTRTYHRLTVAIEDAGFEIRDCMMWLYGQGFPKSLDISKAIDKAAGAEREVVGRKRVDGGWHHEHMINDDGWKGGTQSITAPATDAARTWNGYGTALKPAWEPIVVAMKPLDGTFAENALKWGVAGLAIDAGRIESPKGNGVWGTSNATINTDRKFNASPSMNEYRSQKHPRGRWPANVLLDEETAAMLDEQSGITNSNGGQHSGRKGTRDIVGHFGFDRAEIARPTDTGGASRFFYTAKASRSERDAGLDDHDSTRTDEDYRPNDDGSHGIQSRLHGATVKGRNNHPTVKPLALMEYLCKLTRPPSGGTVLDPFMGSGTTGVACVKFGRNFIGMEINEDYFKIAEKRINDELARPPLFVL